MSFISPGLSGTALPYRFTLLPPGITRINQAR
jgi:hypothetical protein